MTRNTLSGWASINSPKSSDNENLPVESSDSLSHNQRRLEGSHDGSWDAFISTARFSVEPDVGVDNGDPYFAVRNVTLTFTGAGLGPDESDENPPGSDIDSDSLTSLTVTVHFNEGTALTAAGVNEGDIDDGNTFVNPTTGSITYTPTAGFSGMDSFTYTVQDDQGATSNAATVTVTVQAETAPNIVVTPAPYDYGAVTQGGSSSQEFHIVNEGTGALQVSGITLSGTHADQFSIGSQPALPLTIAPGGSQAVDVSFNPSGTGARSADLQITSDDPDQAVVTVSLSGEGVANPVPDIALVPASHDFGDTEIATGQAKTFQILNQGLSDLSVSDLALSGLHASDFSAESDAGSPPFSIAPGTSVELEVTFMPSNFGTRSAVLQITSDDPDENPLDVSLQGNGIGADAEVTPANFGYPDVTIGQSSAHPFTLVNNGTLPLDGSVTLGGAHPQEFRIDQGSGAFTLQPQVSKQIDVSFAPTTVGDKNAFLQVSSNDPLQVVLQVPLSGTAQTTCRKSPFFRPFHMIMAVLPWLPMPWPLSLCSTKALPF